MKYIAILLLLLASCSPCRYVGKHPECFPADTIRIENTKTIRDSIVFTKIDSVGYDLLFECDSNSQVILKEFNEYKTKGISTKFVFKDNRLQLNALIDSLGILHRIIDNYQFKEVVRINPVNEQLKKDFDKLTAKNKTKNKTIFGLIVVILLAAAILKILK